MQQDRGILRTKLNGLSWLRWLIVGIAGIILVVPLMVKVSADLAIPEIRVVVPVMGSIEDLDPARIRTSYDYDIIQNLYGRLLKYDSQSKLVPDLPSSFVSDGRQLRFRFENNPKTTMGNSVGPEDAAISLKRLILIKGGAHGDLWSFLCPNHRIQNLNDDCPGIEANESELVLTPVHPRYLTHLVGMLESADFSIIPKSKIDPSNGKLIDRSHRETSGAYYVESDQLEASSQIVFRRNEFFKGCSPSYPEMVIGINPKNKSSGELLFNGEADILPTSIFFTKKEFSDVKESGEYVFHQTLPFKVMMIRFSEKGIKKTTPEQRRAIGRIAGKAFAKHYGQLGAIPTSQFFQPASYGALDEDRLSEIERSEPSTELREAITFGVLDRHYESLFAELQHVPNLQLRSMVKHAILLEPDDQPDLYYVFTDTAWTESITLLGYNFKGGNFQHPEVDGEQWLKEYIETEDPTSRLRLLQELHYKLLKYAKFVPIEIAPFHAVARKPFAFNQNQIHAGVDWCQITRN